VSVVKTHPKIALEERPQLVVLLKDWVLAYPREPTLQCDAHKAVVWRVRMISAIGEMGRTTQLTLLVSHRRGVW
jgi:hypothetical protein